jgi:uncharacterized damage-inducible protein DinB
MLLKELLLNEFDQEVKTTRKMLERVPDDKFDWKPHPKSMSIKQLSTHIAELPGWMTMAINTNELDFAKGDYKPAPIKNRKELLDYFEQNVRTGRASLENAKEEQLAEIWIMRNGETIYMKGTKGGVIRISISQTIHHRAQLGVFLRLLDIPIPGSYGPSADDASF